MSTREELDAVAELVEDVRLLKHNEEAITGHLTVERVRVAELEVERAAIVDACGFDHDHDPEAPKTLSEYVRETQIMAVRCATEWTSDYKDAAVRRLSRHSKHIGEENERLRARVAELDHQLRHGIPANASAGKVPTDGKLYRVFIRPQSIVVRWERGPNVWNNRTPIDDPGWDSDAGWYVNNSDRWVPEPDQSGECEPCTTSRART